MLKMLFFIIYLALNVVRYYLQYKLSANKGSPMHCCKGRLAYLRLPYIRKVFYLPWCIASQLYCSHHPNDTRFAYANRNCPQHVAFYFPTAHSIMWESFHALRKLPEFNLCHTQKLVTPKLNHKIVKSSNTNFRQSSKFLSTSGRDFQFTFLICLSIFVSVFVRFELPEL